MAAVISSVGIIKSILTITLVVLQDDGTTKNFDYELKSDVEYEITSFNRVEGVLYTTRGKVHSFDAFVKDPCRNHAEYLYLDVSEKRRSKIARIFIPDIKSITEISEF